MTFADSRLFTLDRLSIFYSRSTLDFLLSTLDFLLSTLDFYSRLLLSTFTLDSRPILSTLDPRLLDTLGEIESKSLFDWLPRSSMLPTQLMRVFCENYAWTYAKRELSMFIRFGMRNRTI